MHKITAGLNVKAELIARMARHLIGQSSKKLISFSSSVGGLVSNIRGPRTSPCAALAGSAGSASMLLLEPPTGTSACTTESTRTLLLLPTLDSFNGSDGPLSVSRSDTFVGSGGPSSASSPSEAASTNEAMAPSYSACPEIGVISSCLGESCTGSAQLGCASDLSTAPSKVGVSAMSSFRNRAESALSPEDGMTGKASFIGSSP